MLLFILLFSTSILFWFFIFGIFLLSLNNFFSIIPHYDINNNLIGIRERTLIKENEVYGKYRPAYLNGKLYNHPLSFSLYNCLMLFIMYS